MFCVHGDPCNYFCMGRADGDCTYRHESMLDELVEAVEKSHAEDAKALRSEESREEEVR